MDLRRHALEFLPTMLLAFGLAASLLPARAVLAQESCLDRAGSPAPCPEKERKPKPTPVPPTRTPTATPSPTATPTPTPSPTASPTDTPAAAALLPLEDPGSPDESSSPLAGAPRIPILLPAGLLLGLLLLLLASGVWSLQGVLRHEGPQNADQGSSGKIPHKPFAIVDRSSPTSNPDKLGKVKIQFPNLPGPPPTGGQHEVGHWQGTMGNNAMGDNATGDNALSDNALGGNALSDNALGDNALNQGGDNPPASSESGDGASGPRPS